MSRQSAVIYLRVSTDEQARSGLGLEDQEERCRAYITMRGLDIVEVIADPGVSGGRRLETRAGGKALLGLTRGRRPAARHVVILKLDRAFRNAADCLTVTQEWDRRGVTLHIVDMGGASLDLSTAMGRAFLTMAAAFAELERNLISERVTAAARRTKAHGHAWGGQAPYGFRIADDGKTLEECPAEQAVMALVAELRKEGHSLRDIVEELEAQGVVGRTGKPLQLTQVVRIEKKVRSA